MLYLGRGLWTPPSWVFDGFSVSQRVTGTLGRTAGHFICPLRPFFTLHVFCSRPRFCFFFEARFAMACQTLGSQYRNDEFRARIPRAALRIPRRTLRLLNPVICLDFFYGLGGTLSVFLGNFFWRLSLFILWFFRALSVLFFFRRVFRNELWNGSPGVFGGGIFGPKNALFCVPKTAKEKFSLS